MKRIQVCTILSLVCCSPVYAGGQEHGTRSTAVAASAAYAAGVGIGGAGGAGGSGGSAYATGAPVNVGIEGSSYSSRAYALGAPSFANGSLTCEAQIPLIGGTYEREACAVLRAAAAAHSLLPGEAGRDAVVKETLCQEPRLRSAFAQAGRACAESQQ